MIQLIITRRCNFSCGHCMFSCGSGGANMPPEVFKKAMDYVSKTDSVNLIGGEPSLHIRFKDFLTDLVGKVSRVRVVTNGSWILQTAAAYGFLKAIVAAKSISPDVTVRISNDKWHRIFIAEEDLQKATNFMMDNGISGSSDSLDDAIIYPIGRAQDKTVHSYIAKRGWLDIPAECTKGEYNPWDNLSIDINGDVSPCCLHQAVCGNIMVDSMDTIIVRAEAFVARKKDLCAMNADCGKCG